VSTKDEEDAWRSIVENYGERARLDDDPADQAASADDDARSDLRAREASDAPEAPDAPDAPEAVEVRPVRPDFVPFEPSDDVVDEPAPHAPMHDDEDRFVPETPPLPYVAPRRLTAWAVLVLAPLVLLVCGAADFYVPTPLRALLVVAPLVAFGYLVATMSKDPRDPWDDGARV